MWRSTGQNGVKHAGQPREKLRPYNTTPRVWGRLATPPTLQREAGIPSVRWPSCRAPLQSVPRAIERMETWVRAPISNGLAFWARGSTNGIPADVSPGSKAQPSMGPQRDPPSGLTPDSSLHACARPSVFGAGTPYETP